jgi:hypothetical protein
MNFLFENTYRYRVHNSVEGTLQDLKSVIQSNTTWYDLSVNLTGSVNEDNTFRFRPKFTWGPGSGYFNAYAFGKGKIRPEGDGVIIDIKIGPSRWVTFVYYLCVLLLLFQVLIIIESPDEISPVSMIGLSLLLVLWLSYIRYSARRLRKRFQRFMRIRREK